MFAVVSKVVLSLCGDTFKGIIDMKGWPCVSVQL